MILDGHAANERFTGENEPDQFEPTLEELVAAEERAFRSLKRVTARVSAIMQRVNDNYTQACTDLRQYREENGL